MKRLLTGLGITLLGSVNLVGCATDATEDECLPGDIDCAAPSGGDGKADAFDFKNDPARLSQNLNYRLAELPKTGKRVTPLWKAEYPDAVGKADVVWADTYWPTAEGSHNTRWQGAAVKSPLEKYDAAFNSAPGCDVQPAKIFGAGMKAEWDKYNACAGPAAKWQSANFQNAKVLHDGIDNDADGVVDAVGPSGDVDGVATWWGTCHAWAPASQLLPEPQHAITVNGVQFDVADIKALEQNIFDSSSAVMVGGRCNSKEITHTGTDSANDDCNDGNPGMVHVVMANFVGLANLALVEDRTANFEIWNQPVMGYKVTKQAKISNTAANACVGAPAGNKWTFNTNAAELYEVRMTVEYLTESGAELEPQGSSNHIRTDDYHYILELNAAGKIVGGRYCTENRDDHIDFLWSPTGRFSPSNPNVSVTKVKELIAKSVAPLGGGGGGGPAKVFSATPKTAIPDNSPAGAKADVAVTGLSGSLKLAVSLDITHTFKGDLVVELLRDGTRVKTLHNKAGGSADNIVQTFTLTSAEIGTSLNGTWSVKVVDTAAADVGMINTVSLSFE